MKRYENPKLEVKTFNQESVLTASGALDKWAGENKNNNATIQRIKWADLEEVNDIIVF